MFWVQVNDYLARRDAEIVGQVHRFLGLKVGLVQAGMEEAERREAYNADITYVTNSELGFDYLRDNLAQVRCFLCFHQSHQPFRAPSKPSSISAQFGWRCCKSPNSRVQTRGSWSICA